ncbi:hypothetical protein M0R45_002676 [Rubus argutus]|uniref:Uncharacterized protein n=1 Tax=Rubus argutus TaxID=59490 RepID=A0AAW1VQS4_RUBAR
MKLMVLGNFSLNPPTISLVGISFHSISNGVRHLASVSATEPSEADLQNFGVSDDLRDFFKGLTFNTFKYFPIPDEVEEVFEVPTMASNVRKDLTEWQERHATLVLTTVKNEAEGREKGKKKRYCNRDNGKKDAGKEEHKK